MATPTKSFEVLELLMRHQVEFTVVGMTAAFLQGAPAVTFDLDLLFSRSDRNVKRMMGALLELDAVSRDGDSQERLDEEQVGSRRVLLLMTKYGLVDFYGSISGFEYEDLLADTLTLPVQDMSIRVLSLKRLIDLKARAGREKDLAVLPLLRTTFRRSCAR